MIYSNNIISCSKQDKEEIKDKKLLKRIERMEKKLKRTGKRKKVKGKGIKLKVKFLRGGRKKERHREKSVNTKQTERRKKTKKSHT